MQSYSTYDPQTDTFSLHYNYGKPDLLQGTAVIYYGAIARAEKMLAKYLVRRFLAIHNADEIVSRIDVNKIIAESLQIHATFGEKK